MEAEIAFWGLLKCTMMTTLPSHITPEFDHPMQYVGCQSCHLHFRRKSDTIFPLLPQFMNETRQQKV